MNIPELWLIIVAVAGPIAAVIGSAVQLRQLRKIRLENRKLELEIIELQIKRKAAVTRIEVASLAETMKYGRTIPSTTSSRARPPTIRDTETIILEKAKKSTLPTYISLILFVLCGFLFILTFVLTGFDPIQLIICRLFPAVHACIANSR